jgi:hypothetical protein
VVNTSRGLSPVSSQRRWPERANSDNKAMPKVSQTLCGPSMSLLVRTQSHVESCIFAGHKDGEA